MGYNYTIHYKSTHHHANADALSRLPIGPDDSFIDDDANQVHAVQVELLTDCPVSAHEISTSTETDSILAVIKQFVSTDWSSCKPKSLDPSLVSYYNNRHLLSIVDGCLMKDNQVIIPHNLQPRVLQMLHSSHLGTVKMKQLARSHCWWPTMDKDILNLSNACFTCSILKPLPKSEYKSWPEPDHVWSRVHMDFAGPFWGSKWLLLVDAKSKFPFVADMQNDTSASNLSKVLDHVIDWFGPPDSLVSDNGPPFNSYAMRQFYSKYGITHVTTAPYHPASNGLAERFVRSFKDTMKKQLQSGETDKHIALRNFLRTYRWSPHTSTGVSPANLMFQHTIRTDLERMKPISSSPTAPLQSKYVVGQSVWALKPLLNHRSQWKTAVITRIISSMVYEVTLADGQCIKRHQNQLRPRHSTDQSFSDIDSLPDDISPDKLLPMSTDVTTAPISSPSLSSNSIPAPPPPAILHPSSSPRYPTRTRRAPDRYSPS
ncbi:unnamed protein product [Adineta ricciae]|uniref:Integrase catalytic domain-containing protein n=1 Tax=Adineta ricciae TaxID=249248 RepID=A0A815MDA6_ADIRI|nr:unnamed protein product [Adineta ricciae]